MPFNDIYRLRVYQRLHGSQVVNVYHFVQEDPTPATGALELASDWVTNMRATSIARASNELLFEYVEVQSLVPFSGGPVTVNFPASTIGTVVAPCHSATLCEVITMYSSRAGRRGRGRMYLAGAPTQSTSISAGTWLSAQTTRTQTFATAVATRYMVVGHPSGFSLGVWSRVLAGPDPPFSSDGFVRASALTVRTIVRTQRRRQVGVGR